MCCALVAACSRDDDRSGEAADVGSGINPSGAATDVDADDGADAESGSGGSSGGPADPGGGPEPCGEGGSIDFSFIWIANSPEGTVSKVDTQSATEVARYRTGPGEPDPSRTSVNLAGDVAVLNRAGGVAKIAAIEERCVDANGDGIIQTSTGPDDVLDWGADECVLWYQDLPFVPDPDGGNRWGPRPIAWDFGVMDPDGDPCDRVGETLWGRMVHRPRPKHRRVPAARWGDGRHRGRGRGSRLGSAPAGRDPPLRRSHRRRRRLLGPVQGQQAGQDRRRDTRAVDLRGAR